MQNKGLKLNISALISIRLLLCTLILPLLLLCLSLPAYAEEDDNVLELTVTDDSQPMEQEELPLVENSAQAEESYLTLKISPLSPVYRIGDLLTWDIVFTDAELFEYTLLSPSGAELKHESVNTERTTSPTSYQIIQTADVAGAYSLTVKVSNSSGGTAEQQSDAEVDVAKLFVSLTSDQKYANVGSVAKFNADIVGGLPPYEVEFRVELDGECKDIKKQTQTSPGSFDFTYAPQSGGGLVVFMTVLDARAEDEPVASVASQSGDTKPSTDGGAQPPAPSPEPDGKTQDDINAVTAVASLRISSDKRETAAQWEKDFEHIKLTGDWRDDLIAIAETQLDYHESTANFYIDDLGNESGYTRYGDWYGPNMHYSEWCAMFISFCLHYAEVPTDYIPPASSVTMWKDELSDLGLYMDDEASYTPDRGDLVFFNLNENPGVRENEPTHVGIVEKIEGGKLCTIEGNHHNDVARYSYDLDSSRIIGYLDMKKAMESAGKSYSRSVDAALDGSVIKLTAILPPDVSLEARALSADDIALELEPDELVLAYNIALVRAGNEGESLPFDYTLDAPMSVSLSSDRLLENPVQLSLADGSSVPFEYSDSRTLSFKLSGTGDIICTLHPDAHLKTDSIRLALRSEDFEPLSGSDTVDGKDFPFAYTLDLPVNGAARGSRIELDMTKLSDKTSVSAFLVNEKGYSSLPYDSELKSITLTDSAENSSIYVYITASGENPARYRLRIVLDKLINYWTVEPSCADAFPESPLEPRAEAKYGELSFRWYEWKKDIDLDSAVPLDAAPTEQGKYILRISTEESSLYTGLDERLTVSVYPYENPSNLTVDVAPVLSYNGVSPKQSEPLSSLKLEKQLMSQKPRVLNEKGEELSGEWSFCDAQLIISEVVGGKVKLCFTPNDEHFSPCIYETELKISVCVKALDQALLFGSNARPDNTLFSAFTPENEKKKSILCDNDEILVTLIEKPINDIVSALVPIVSVSHTDLAGNASDVTSKYDIKTIAGSLTRVRSYVSPTEEYNRITGAAKKLVTVPADGCFTVRLDLARASSDELSLDFGDKLPSGTKITMIDYSGSMPVFYGYLLGSAQSRFKLGDFVRLDLKGSVPFKGVEAEGEVPPTVQLQFVVALGGNASGKQYSMSLYEAHTKNARLLCPALPFTVAVTDKASAKIETGEEDAIVADGTSMVKLKTLNALGSGRKVLAVTLTRDGSKAVSLASGSRPITIEYDGKEPYVVRGNIAFFDLGEQDIYEGGVIKVYGAGIARGTKYKLQADICIVPDDEMSYPLHGSKAHCTKSFTA